MIRQSTNAGPAQTKEYICVAAGERKKKENAETYGIGHFSFVMDKCGWADQAWGGGGNGSIQIICEHVEPTSWMGAKADVKQAINTHIRPK